MKALVIKGENLVLKKLDKSNEEQQKFQLDIIQMAITEISY